TMRGGGGATGVDVVPARGAVAPLASGGRGAGARVATTGRASTASGGRRAGPLPATKLAGAGRTGTWPCSGSSRWMSAGARRVSCTARPPKWSPPTVITALRTPTFWYTVTLLTIVVVRGPPQPPHHGRPTERPHHGTSGSPQPSA